MQLAGKVALVTGASHRLGRAIAGSLAAEGAALILHWRTREGETRAAADAIRAGGGRALLVQADLGTPEAVRALVEQATAGFGRLDVLVNNAALFYPTRLSTRGDPAATAERDRQWDELMAVNLRAPVVAALAAAEAMPEGGSIINITDTSVATPWPDYLAYQTAKAGLEAATRYLARALAPRIRVNAVAPGAILMAAGATAADEARALQRVPLARLGSAEDVAAAVLYLASAPYVTGIVVPVDGGRRIG